MISARQSVTGVDFVRIDWSYAVHKPDKYVLSFSCTVNPEKHDCEDVSAKATDIKSETTSFTLLGLLPGTVCVIKLFAVYNPASIDSGIMLITSTTTARAEGEFACMDTYARKWTEPSSCFCTSEFHRTKPIIIHIVGGR